MGAWTQPGDEPADQPVDDIVDMAADLVGDAESVRLDVGAPAEPPLSAPSRPLTKLVGLLVVLGCLLVVNDRSAAGGERSLRTSDAARYVEPAATVPAAAPTPTVVASDPSSSLPATYPTEMPASVHAATTSTAVPTGTTMVAADAPTTPADTSLATTPVSPPATADPSAGGAGGDADVSRAIPDQAPSTGASVESPWADKARTTAAGYIATDVGCASGTSPGALDAFFKERVGPVLGHDYQHVYPLGGDRYLWLFQDTFVDYSGTATSLGQATFDHNTAMIQDGACFTLYHRGSITAPASFEQGTGENWKSKWFWPMGGQTVGGRVYVFWAQMSKDGYNPTGANGLGWHPVETWLAVYDVSTLQRLSFQPAANPGTTPIYGYAVASDDEYTYLFGNTFEQNLQREGGYFNGPHSGTKMWLARVPVGHLGAAPEYRSGDTWTSDETQATPISERYWAENPMEPRYLNGQWVAATKVDGYWGGSLVVDVANHPWGPWTTVEDQSISPRGGDPLMNTYNAYLMPWTSGGALVVSVSENARNMLRDAWPKPSRYRLMFFGAALVTPPPDVDDSTTTTVDETTTIPDTTTTVPSTSDPATTTTFATSTTSAATTTSDVATTTTSSVATSIETTTTTTTVPPETTTTSTVPPTVPATTTTTTVPATAPATTAPPCPDPSDPSTTSTSTTTTTTLPGDPPPAC